MQAFLKVVTVAIMLTFGIADVAGCQQRVGPSALADILSIMDPQELRQLAQQLKILGQFDGRVEGVQGNELEASVLHAYIIYSANGGEAYDMQHWQSIRCPLLLHSVLGESETVPLHASDMFCG